VPWIGAWETAAAIPPAAPTGVTAGSVTPRGVTASWTPGDGTATGFDVQWAPTPFSVWTAFTGSPAAGGATSLASGNVLADGTAHRLRVRAKNANGDSAWVEANFTTVALVRFYPISDAAAGSWTPSTGSTLAGVIDEAVPSPTDFMSATAATPCFIRLAPSTTPAIRTFHSVPYWASNDGAGQVRVSLVQGYPGSTTIATELRTLTVTDTEYSLAVSQGEAETITDYSALLLKFEVV
jgi:hypothetical protein